MTKNPFETNYIDSQVEGRTTLSPILNALTILTLVGSALGMIFSISSYFTSQKNYETLRDAVESGQMDDAPSWMRSLISQDMVDNAQKLFENRLPIAVIGFLGSLLCLYGALEMRKLKSQGYTIWMLGEVLPVFAMLFLIGFNAFTGFNLLNVIIPGIFIFLYTTRRSELIN
jgi:hypothetical protein